jgi:deoxyribonuclease-1-like protein
MPKLLILGLLAAAAIGGWYLWQNYQIEGLDTVHVKPRAAAPAGSQALGKAEAELPPVPAGKSTIRIATFNLGPLDQNKISKPQVVNRLAQVIRRFDLVAVQDVQARNRAILAQLVEQVNADARHYNVVVPPDVDQDVVHQYSAFLFDRATIQVDPSTVYLVNDPAGRFRRPPLVASFRARGPDASQAFTFTLINVHTDPERAAVEVSLLADVFRAVRDNGRSEDDVILLGDLGTDERHLGQMALVPNITCAVFGMPTTTRGTEISDNILFDFRATKEFTGKSGVVDLMRELGLSMPETIETASHLPVWAEFSVYEGGQTGQVAESPPPAVR